MGLSAVHGLGLDPGLGIALRDAPFRFGLSGSTPRESSGLRDPVLRRLLVQFIPALPLSLLIPVVLLAAFPSAMGRTAEHEALLASVSEVEAYAVAVAPVDSLDRAEDLYEWYEAMISLKLEARSASWYDGYAFDLLGSGGYRRRGAGYGAGLVGLEAAAAVPEPSTALLLACGLAGLALSRKRAVQLTFWSSIS